MSMYVNDKGELVVNYAEVVAKAFEKMRPRIEAAVTEANDSIYLRKRRTR